MKKFSTVLLAAVMLLPTTSAMTSCSDDDPVEETEKPQDNPQDNNDGESDNDNPNDNSGGNLPGIPQDVLIKVNEIYSKASTGPQDIKTISQLAIITSICAAREVDGPISVTNASLNNEDVTLVTLGGTENKEGQATTLQESQLAAFGKSNDYLTAVCRLFDNGTIPNNKPVIVTGISLGGMIAQQLLGVKEITDNFELRNIITFGSPLTLPFERNNVKVIRFADANDKVPQLGETVLRNGMVTGSTYTKEELVSIISKLDQEEKIVRNGKYTGMIETHALSYIEDDCWNDIDFLGDKSRSNILRLKQDMTFYPAPQIKK